LGFGRNNRGVILRINVAQSYDRLAFEVEQELRFIDRVVIPPAVAVVEVEINKAAAFPGARDRSPAGVSQIVPCLPL
jgi:hypothetical protein